MEVGERLQQTQGSLLGPCTRAAVGRETRMFSYFPDMGFMVATLAVAIAAAVRVCKTSQNSRQCNCNQCK